MKKRLSALAVAAITAGSIAVATHTSRAPSVAPQTSPRCGRWPSDGGRCTMRMLDGGTDLAPLHGYVRGHRIAEGCEVFDCPREP